MSWLGCEFLNKSSKKVVDGRFRGHDGWWGLWLPASGVGGRGRWIASALRASQ